MRVYLTGGTGFVASNVARVFAERQGAEPRRSGSSCPTSTPVLARLRRELETGEIGPDPFAAESTVMAVGSAAG